MRTLEANSCPGPKIAEALRKIFPEADMATSSVATKRGPVARTKINPQVDALRKLRIIIRAAQRHSQWIEKQCGVSGAQLWVLQELYESPGLRVGEVAERLAIFQPTASNLLDSLRKRGLVAKQRDDADQRIVKLALTAAGKALVKKAPKPSRGLLPEALRCMGKKGLSDLNKGLQALIDAIEGCDEGNGLLPLPFTL